MIANKTYPAQHTSSFQYRYLTTGFHLLVAFWLLNAFFPAEGLSAQKIANSALLLLALLCFGIQILLGAAESSFSKFDYISKLLLALLIGWCLITIARGFEPDVSRLFTLLANPDIGGLVWLLPFAVYIGRQPRVLHALLPTFRLHAIVGIALTAWTIVAVGLGGGLPLDNKSRIGIALLYAAPVVLLTGIGGQRDRWLYISGLGLMAIAYFFLGNRAPFAMTVGILLLVLTLGRVRNLDQISLRMLTLTVIATALVLLGADYLLSRLPEDWFVDTRTFLWVEMNDDFSAIDWLVGRGALGIYYSPYFEMTNRLGLEGDWMYRQVNEIGYLHIALKAGLIGVILYFLTFARAIYKSLLIPNRRFAVGLALILSMHLFELAVVGQASMRPSRVLLWILVGIALSAPSKRA